jgi:hypothetical protein
MLRLTRAPMIVFSAALLCSCQSPTDPDDTIDVDDYVEATSSPDPVIADLCTDGKTYNVTVNDVTEKRLYDWKATFSVTVRLNDKAADKDLDLAFPVDVTAATFEVDQATGGIRNPPSGGELEYSQSTIVQSTGNRYAGSQHLAHDRRRSVVRLAQPAQGRADRGDAGVQGQRGTDVHEGGGYTHRTMNRSRRARNRVFRARRAARSNRGPSRRVSGGRPNRYSRGNCAASHRPDGGGTIRNGWCDGSTR